MKRIAICGVVALLTMATGCSGDDKGSESSGTPSASPTAETPTPAPTADLKETCPEVEAALPRDLMVPSAKQLVRIRARMEPLLASADLEAKNALNLFVDGIDRASAAYTDPSVTMPGLDASEAFDQGLSAFADRCKAAGSTALQ